MCIVFDTGHAHPDAHHVAELGIVGGHDQVARPDQHQTRGDRVALHLGDGDLAQITPTAGVLEEVVPLLKIGLFRDGLAGGPVDPEARKLIRARCPLAKAASEPRS